MQNIVKFDIGNGIAGELALEGFLKAQPGVLSSAAPANNVVGRLFSQDPTTGKWRAGNPGTNGTAFAILANPKVYASNGTVAGGSLAPTMTLPNEANVELVTSTAGIWVNSLTAADLDETPYFSTVTGEIAAYKSGDTPAANFVALVGGKFVRFPQAATGGLMVLALTQ